MIAESSEVQKFRQIIGDAPELIEPIKIGQKNILFTVCKVDERSGKGILETKKDVLGRFTRVEYSESCGLGAQRLLFLRDVDKDEPVMEYGHVRYSQDDVDIILAAVYNSPFLPPELAKDWLSDPNNFQINIGIFPKDKYKDALPLANVCYGFSSQIPVNAEFLYADYRDALEGNVEKLDQGEFTTRRYHYRKTYFQWENLVGAKVGVQRFKEGDTYPRHYRWLTKINNPAAVVLEDTPYKEKITHFQERFRNWGEGRLRFSRINSETGESWFFSVPEWMDNADFIRDLRGKDLGDFSHLYPVKFCVKRPGEKRQWFSTSFRDDRPYKFE